jgi:hypothetical protein
VELPERGKSKGKPVEEAKTGPNLAPTESPGATVSPFTPESGKLGKGKRGEKLGTSPPPTGPTADPEGMTAPEGKRRGFERQNITPTPRAAGTAGENFSQPRGKNKKIEQPSGMSPVGPQNTPVGAQGVYSEGRGKHKAEGVTAPPTGGGQLPAGTGQPGEKKHEGKGKGAATPTPAPR